MKKQHINMMKLGAGMIAAVAASGSFAQETTSVQLYGLLGVYAGKVERSNGVQSSAQLANGGLTTPYWGVRGSEDLGGGIKAIFALESFFGNDTGAMGRNTSDPLFSRNAFVGFEGSLGKLTFGRQTNPTYSNMGLLSPFGVSVAFSPLVLHNFVLPSAAGYAPYNNGAIIGDTVWNNTIQYSSARVGGFAGNIIYGLGEVAGSSGTANLGLHGNYVAGNLTVAASAQRFRTLPAAAVIAGADQQYAYLAGAAYDFKMAKVYGSVAKTETDGTDNDTRTYDLGLKVPVSASGSVLAEWAFTRTERPGRSDNLRNTGSIGYDHFLSKRTDIYAVLTYDRQSGFDDANTIGLGIRHTF